MTNFEKLYKVNVNEHTEDRDGFKYLSWAWAWAEFKKACPDAHYQVWKDADGKPYIYDEKLGYMVMVEVTAGDETHSMWLPVMDGANKAMKDHPYQYTVKNKNFKFAKWDEQKQGYYDKYGNEQKETIVKRVDQASMFDINTAIMRCLTKCLAMFGLGLYIYAGEDLPHREMVKPVAPCTMDNKEMLCQQFCNDNDISVANFCKWFKIQSLEQMDEERCNYFNGNYEQIYKDLGGNVA